MLPDLESLAMQGFEVRALEERQSPRRDLVGIWQAFNDLHAHRSVGFSVNPITVESILGYLDLIGVTNPPTKRQYFRLISAMDDEYLAHIRTKDE